jgi:O-antigen ligase
MPSLSFKIGSSSKEFLAFSLITIISILLSVVTYSVLPAVIPLIIIGLYISIVDLRLFYYLLVGLLAISTELELPGGIGMDFPGEPIMIFITVVYFILILFKPKEIVIPLKNPITFLIILHVCWIGITSITSEDSIVSLKFFLAKIWYVVPFYFAFFLFIKTRKQLNVLLTTLMLFVAFGAFYVMLNHISLGLTFDTIEKAVQPIYRNHVNYACLLTITLPYLWFISWVNRKNVLYRFIVISLNLFILIAIYYSFTRAAIGSVVIGLGAFVVLRMKLTRFAFIASVLIGLFFANYMIQNNRFMDFAPNFEKTISHTDFDNLLEATAKGEDISTMERVYRWIAGARMIYERPIVGYGPNNFYPYYKHKTVTSFETYVSDNPEKSGIHCYYLMIPVEQGIPGAIIFLLLCFYLLYEAEKAYHQTKNLYRKYLVAASFVSLVSILAIIIVNDLLEADKVGPFFFLAGAIIVYARMKNNKEKDASELSKRVDS